MGHTVVVSRPAADDIAAAIRWLLQPGSGRVARDRLKQIRKAVNGLGTMPLLHPLGEHPGIRERPVAGYRILYTFEPGPLGRAGTVNVLRVFGPGQDRAGV